MFETLKSSLLEWLRIPPIPEPPRGSPESVRIFTAAPNFYKLLLLKWGLTQVSALIGIVVSLVFWHSVAFKVPSSLRTALFVLESLAVTGFVAQLPFTYAMLRLDFELRWYIVTDRSLRIRSGILSIREMTMTFANIQQITIAQGPLQRLLQIADLRVTTAGGGGGAGHAGHGQSAESMHVGYFHGVANAPEIRDLMLERLRRLRDTGLGDPDEPISSTVGIDDQSPSPFLQAAHELLVESRALRRVLTSRVK